VVRKEDCFAYEHLGIEAIQQGKVAAVIMSGGQGTQLGYDGPKGKYSIGLPSNKSIFQLHIERIQKLRQLCSTDSPARIAIYIMTSDLNHNEIISFFTEHDFFGYPKQDVLFFEQGLEPCFTFDGKVILSSKTQIALAPDGNGGLYKALKHSGCFQDMLQRGIEHLHIYGIDNVLTKSCDPCSSACASPPTPNAAIKSSGGPINPKKSALLRN
jgi:UDP-N-acetylglucosamine/UDP-N-acetylgalactosamine diphosphorylase